MKVLIVDDERDVRDSIRLLVDWEEYGITDIAEAADGASAMELIEMDRPEIIFTDMKMPNVDGMSLLQWVEANAPESKRIVISGYDDYTYMRKTVKHGGLDYLLKPINRNELLEALRQAVNSWRKDDEARRKNVKKDVEINKTLPMYWDKILSGVVSQAVFYSTVADELQAAFGWSGVREGQVAMLMSAPLPRVAQDKFGHNLDLLYFLMSNICNEVIGGTGSGYAFRHTDPNYGLILLLTEGPGESAAKLKAIGDALHRVLGARFHMALSRSAVFPAGLHAAFQETLQAARSVSYVGEGGYIHSISDLPEARAGRRIVLADYGSPISAAVHRGDHRQIGSAVAKWIQAVRQLPAVTWEELKYWRYEFELLCNRLLQNRKPGEPSRQSAQGIIPIGPDGRLSFEEWQREWTHAFTDIAEILKEASQSEYNAIHSIKAYIDANYMHNLSLQDLAAEFFLSREYVSRKFKQVYNENLSEYLERVRIEQAKNLLARGQHKISDVAERVGYQDGRYFSKIFSKLTGMTPREWRKDAGPQARDAVRRDS